MILGLRQPFRMARFNNIWDILMLKKVFLVYLKFEFNWVFCAVSGNPTRVKILLGGEQLPWLWSLAWVARGTSRGL